MSSYDDIIHLPYPRKPPRMSNYDRAAQFAPFAALTGYEAAIGETARITETAIELGEDGLAILNEKLRRLEPGDEVTVIWFRPDARKAGGAYIRHIGTVKRVDATAGALVMADGAAISFGQIRDIVK